MSGAPARLPSKWIQRASCDLPVPDSPTRSTVVSVAATCFAAWSTCFIAGLSATIPRWSVAISRWLLRSAASFSSSRRTRIRSSSIENGFVR